MMTTGAMSALEPGQFVRHPARPEWGVGQVQSAVGDRVTVNFEHAGKVMVHAGRVALEPLPGPPDAMPQGAATITP